MINWIKKVISMFISIIIYYISYFYCKIKKINNDDLWLISERGTDARDNAYHFYKYMKLNHPEITVKFIISKSSSDRIKIDEEDIVNYKSFQHYILFITAGKLISTHIMGFSPNVSLFWRMDMKKPLKIKGKRIFLQHGITKDFMFIMTSKASKVDLFICGAKPEYDFILENFGYDDTVVKYTGFARYDNLISDKKRQILIMPTWRKWLNYVNDFSKTLYFNSWNNFLNNKKFIEYIEKNDIEVIFYPHYEIQKYLDHFKTSSNNIKIADFEHYDVQKLLIESQLLITDYSSVFFDFAFMKKNLVYYQFDEDEYRKKHYTEGYFDYKKMGFGPVVNDETSLIKNVIKLFSEEVNTNKNIEKFFPINDKNNCDRIYDEIIKL